MKIIDSLILAISILTKNLTRNLNFSSNFERSLSTIRSATQLFLLYLSCFLLATRLTAMASLIEKVALLGFGVVGGVGRVRGEADWPGYTCNTSPLRGDFLGIRFQLSSSVSVLIVLINLLWQRFLGTSCHIVENASSILKLYRREEIDDSLIVADVLHGQINFCRRGSRDILAYLAFHDSLM